MIGARINHAHRCGASSVSTDTGVAIAGQPNHSQRNSSAPARDALSIAFERATGVGAVELRYWSSRWILGSASRGSPTRAFLAERRGRVIDDPSAREPAPPGQASAKTHSAETHDALKHWALLGWQADCVGHRLFAQKVSGVHASTAAQS